ncbi:MAG: M48 family metalloprotease [Alphaproteobacteria bacterium]
MLKRLTALIAIVLLVVPHAAGAQQQPRRDTGPGLIRDAEIETILRIYAKPVLEASGLGADNVQIHIVNDPRLNAFVAGGQHIFLNTGLLMRANRPEQVVGVIAHESGHIAGNHLTRLHRELEEAQIKQIIALILGAAAAAMARDPNAAVGAIGLGARIIEGDLLAYTRTQEAAADQFALNSLARIGVTPRGLMEFLELLAQQEFMITAQQDPYVRTHPLTAARIDFLRQHLAKNPQSDVNMAPRFYVMHKRLRAKLIGFLEPQRAFEIYPETDKSMDARYARAIAYHRVWRMDDSLALMESLLKEYPRDPYFHELKGQILLESGHARDSLPSLDKAAQLAPYEPLIRTLLAQAQLELNEPQYDRQALGHLTEATRRDPNNPLTWRLYATAQGRIGNIGLASLALAEEAILMRDLPQLNAQIARGERTIKPNTPAWERLQDLKRFTARLKGRVPDDERR